MVIKENVSLADYTSWQIGGPADFFAQPETLEELKESLSWARRRSLAVTVLGGGSNVLISDQGLRGFVCCLRRFSGLEAQENLGRLEIKAKSGTAKSELLKVFLKHQLAPSLFLAGLPGDVGGGVVMNAGVAENFEPREFGEIVDWVDVLQWSEASPDSYQLRRYSHNELAWGYRHSRGWQPGIVVEVGLSWPLQPDPDVLKRVREANRLRLSKQPLDMPSCGSVFKNPPNKKAAQLIDSCGLKGFQIGAAQVSLKHANFMVNLGGARAADMLALIEHVQKAVKSQTGVDLETEVIRLGF